MGGIAASPLQNPKLLQMLQALSKIAGAAGQGIANRPPAQAQPGQTGQAPTPSAPPQYNLGGGAPAGQFPQPTATPPKQGYTPPQGGNILQQKLDPQGAAVYSAVQGVSQLLQQFEQRKDSKEHAEAENIAKNLMAAMDATNSSDPKAYASAVATIHDILNDKHSTKVLNKVYKGWLQKSQEAQKPGEPPDPAIAGFEKGLQNFVAGKGQRPQMPPTMGGYRMPQAGPAQALQSMAQRSEMGAAQQDPARQLQTQMTSGEDREYQLERAGLKAPTIYPPQVQLQVDKFNMELDKATIETQKAQLEYDSARQKAITSGKRDETSLENLRLKNEKARIDLDIKKQQLVNAREKGTGLKSTNQSYQLKWQMVSKAEEALNLMVANKQKLDKTNVMGIANLLKNAGATSIASDLVKQQGSIWVNYGLGSYNTPEQLLGALKDYKDAYQKTFMTEKAAVGASTPGVAEGAAESNEGEEVSDEDTDIVVSSDDLNKKE